MNFKKRLRLRDIGLCALGFLLCFALPLWLFMVAMIVNTLSIWLLFIGLISLNYFVIGRIDT